MSEQYLLDGLPVATYPFELEKALEGCLLGLLQDKTKIIKVFFLIEREHNFWFKALNYFNDQQRLSNTWVLEQHKNLVLLQEKKSPIFHYRKVRDLWEVQFSITSVKAYGYTPKWAFSNLQAKRKKLNGATK